MKKVYSILLFSAIFLLGNLSAQNMTEIDTKVTKKERVVKKELSVDASQTSTETRANRSTTRTNENSSKSKTEGRVVTKKITITKEQLDKQSDRGKEHILAHPEIYSVEQ